MKRMLLIFQHNFLNGGMGVNNRIISLVKLFKELEIKVDLFSFTNIKLDNGFERFNEQNIGLINNLYLNEYLSNPFEFLFNKALYYIFNRDSIYFYDTPKIVNNLKEVLDMNKYDIICTFYTYFAKLLSKVQKTSKFVYFMEDSCFLQKHSGTNLNLGKILNSELKYINVFDEIFCISYDEKIMYEKFLDKNINFLPHIIEKKNYKLNIKYDIFFVGYDNPYNKEGIIWFIKNVYPLLDKKTRILIGGSCTKYINDIYDNINIVPFINDLDKVYKESKIVICPIFHGTGMKIKVVEALSYGIPVVCTSRGVDGMPNKFNNGCLVSDDPNNFAKNINLLIKNKKFYNEISNNAKEFFNTVFEKKQYIDMLKLKLL